MTCLDLVHGMVADSGSGRVISMKAFEAFQLMCDDDMDIRIWPLENIISVDIKGMNGVVCIGVDRATAHRLMEGGNFVGGLLLADKKEFDGIMGKAEG